MSLSQPRQHPSIVVPIGVLIIAMLCFQLGASLASHLFPLVGAAGTTALRLGLSSVMLTVVFKPWRLRFERRVVRYIVIYGVAMGCMNLCFYLSLDRIPMGVAVALEFTGPLSVAVATSRRAIDFAWVALAVVGLVALLPLAVGAAPLDPLGVVYSLVAGAFWAVYILYGQKAGGSHGGATTAIGTVIGAVFIVPIGIAQAGAKLWSPSLLPLGCVLALISSALPYSLEMFALTRMPARTFGILMSADPAFAALAGFVLLGQRLSAVQCAGIVCVTLASAGSATTRSV